MTLTRGERNHNPYNLRFNPRIRWQGLADPAYDEAGFCVFADDAWGLRAGFKDLHAKWARGLDTVAKIVPVYAPASENDVARYVAAVCSDAGVGPDQKLDFSVRGNLLAIGRAFIRHEIGHCPYSDAQLKAAADQALATNPGAFMPSPSPAPVHQTIALGGTGAVVVGLVVGHWYHCLQARSFVPMDEATQMAHATLLIWAVSAYATLRGKKLPPLDGTGPSGAPGTMI